MSNQQYSIQSTAGAVPVRNEKGRNIFVSLEMLCALRVVRSMDKDTQNVHVCKTKFPRKKIQNEFSIDVKVRIIL